MLRAAPLFTELDLAAMRRSARLMTAAMPKPEGVEFEPVDAGGVRAEWARAEGAGDGRALVYFHGGGYVLFSVETHRALCGAISRAADLPVLSVDYRLGPEHPFPAAVEDGVAAFHHLLERGYAPASIALGGDSAGGGLVAATLIALRDAGSALPGAGVCISPWADLTLSGPSMKSRADDDPLVSEEALALMACAYLGDADPKSPTASPAFADLTGLPPLLIQAGTAEILLDDARTLAANAERSGVDVTLECWDEMIHVWHAFVGSLPEADQAVARIAEFLLEKLD